MGGGASKYKVAEGLAFSQLTWKTRPDKRATFTQNKIIGEARSFMVLGIGGKGLATDQAAKP